MCNICSHSSLLLWLWQLTDLKKQQVKMCIYKQKIMASQSFDVICINIIMIV